LFFSFPKASQYRIEYQKYWENYWHKASTATQRRLAEDGKVYTVPEFVQHLAIIEFCRKDLEKTRVKGQLQLHFVVRFL